jgi:hypothetical protein
MSRPITFSPRGILWILSLALWVFPQMAFSQGFSVTGQVTDAHTQNPLEGVSIAVQGTTNGTISDGNGNFRLEVNPGDSLMISCLGYQGRTVVVQNASPLAITLTSQSSSLTGVVVIGYGERQKKDVTGAISTVDASQIEHGTAMSPVMALQGNAPGVFIESGGGEPQAKPTVRIRGVNTFGFADPLYVVDGIPIWESTQGSDLSSPITTLGCTARSVKGVMPFTRGLKHFSKKRGSR